MERTGFKEWAVICAALGAGEQSLILRKGGLAEGREGFSFRHPEFFLFPTYFHEQYELTSWTGERLTEATPDQISIQFFAKVEEATVINSWETVQALAPLHLWQEAVVRERFDYDEAGRLHVALVRVFRVEPTWILPNEKRFGGCRSWVTLPEPSEALRFGPVLSDAEHAERAARFRDLIGTSDSGSRT